MEAITHGEALRSARSMEVNVQPVPAGPFRCFTPPATMTAAVP